MKIKKHKYANKSQDEDLLDYISMSHTLRELRAQAAIYI